jgi:hypothetical protein
MGARRKFFLFFVAFFVYMIAVFALMGLAWKYEVESGLSKHWPIPVLMLLVLMVLIGMPPALYSRFSAGLHGWRKRLLETGQEAPAEIMSVQDTGVSLGNEDLSYFVLLTLTVTPPGAPPFTAKLEAYVSRAAVPRAGDLVMVKFDPNDRSKVVLMDASSGSTPTRSASFGTDHSERREAFVAAISEATQTESQDGGQAAVLAAIRDAAQAAGKDGRQARIISLSGDDAPSQLGALMETLGARRDATETDAADRLAELDTLRQRGLLTDEEFAAQRQRILGSI